MQNHADMLLVFSTGVVIISPYPSVTRCLQVKIFLWLCQTDGDGVVDIASYL
jgi:hypothetical protein